MVRRAGRGQKQQAGSAPAAGPAEAAEDTPAAFDPDELLPRADISGHITGKLVTSLGSANWKERNAAVEEVEEILKAAGSRIQPSLGDLMPALKVRTGKHPLLVTCLEAMGGKVPAKQAVLVTHHWHSVKGEGD